jgi:hypothetical protein
VEVLVLTIFISLLLAGLFLLLFLVDRRGVGERRGLEQQSLLPLEDDHGAVSGGAPGEKTAGSVTARAIAD